MSDLDTTPLTFGKYKGQTPEDVAELDPSYIVWLFDTVTPKRCSKALALACEDEIDDDDHFDGGWDSHKIY